MSLISKEDLFNEEFNTYLKSRNKIDYINDLLSFTLDKNYLTEEQVNEISLNLQKNIVEYILKNEKKCDYDSDISDVRKNKAKKILYSISNYLIEKDGYSSLALLNNLNSSLIVDSLNYYKEYINKLNKKLEELKKVSNIEYTSHMIYKVTIDKLDMKFNDFSYDFDSLEKVEYKKNNYVNIDYYHPLNYYLKGPLKNDSYLYEYENFIDDLMIESKILNNFDDKVLKNIIAKLFTISEDYSGFANENYSNNICEHVLINYSLLSIYSDTPNNLEVSCNMYKVLANELNNGTIDKQELKNIIYNGKVKFSEEELEYINQHFIERSIEKETGKVFKDCILKLIK